MFKWRSSQGSSGTALESRPASIVEAGDVVRLVGEMMVQRLWPIQAEVQVSCKLPLVTYDENEFWRLMEILIGRALGAFPPASPSPLAIVAARDGGPVTIFSVHTPASRAFSGEHRQDPLGDDIEYRTWEARAIVERNGGRFWVDDRNGSGSTAYFTLRN